MSAMATEACHMLIGGQLVESESGAWDDRTHHRASDARRHRWINGYGAHYMAVPFGGVNNSGISREEAPEEMLDYTEIETINVILGRPRGGGAEKKSS